MGRLRFRSLAEVPPQLRGKAEAALAAWNVGPASNDGHFSPPRRKYGNVPVTQDGQKFPSKAQARTDRKLRIAAAAGEINGYLSEVSVRLPSGKRMRLDHFINQPEPHACWKCGAENLIATLVLADTKGLITPEWKAKCAELEAALGVKVRIYKGG